MEESNGKCLLDVIGDPSALKEFLKSNSQVAVEAQKNSAASSKHALQLAQQNATQLNHVSALMKSPPRGMINHTVSTIPGRNVVVTNTPSVIGLTNCLNQTRTGSPAVPGSLTSHSPVAGHRTFVANKTAGVNSAKGLAVPAAAVTSARAFANTNTGNFSKSAASVVRTTVSATGKQHTNNSVSFQAKKPIPIKPKNPTLMPASSLKPVAGTMLKGLPVLTSTAVVSQGQTRQAVTAAVTQGQRNGVDMSSIALANAQAKKVYPVSTQHLTTQTKRIAPKHQVILPQQMHVPSQKLSAQSPGNLQTVMVSQMSPGMPSQSQASLTYISSSNLQQKQEMQPQQFFNVIQQPSPTMTSVHQGVTQHITQPPQVLGSQVKHIQQIEQLVQQKLPNLQQSTVVQTTQSQGSTQHNLAFQEQVLKQLIIQAQHPTSGSAVQQVQQQRQVKEGMQRQVIKQAVVPQQLQLSRQQQQAVQVQRNATVQNKVPVPNPGSPVSTQLQHLVDHQQKQLQLILGQQQQPQQQQQKLLIPTTQAQQQVYQQVVQDVKSLTPTIQHVTPAQLQQLQQQNSGGVQKVFIIKQPELLQKLGVQGGKAQHTIQITPQQLQTLKQLQQPQTQAQQGTHKTFVLNKAGTTQPQVLTMEQVKQLQQQGVQIKPLQVQNKTAQQRTVLSPQLQTQLQVTAKPQSKMQHIPRILQTSGRQPVTSSKVGHPVIKMSVLPKQEQNKGVKRPHPELAPDVPKVVTRLKQSLVADQQSVLHPDLKRKFTSQEEAVKKLAKYHVYYDPDPSPKDIEKADGLFNLVSTQLVKRSQRMVDKYRHLLIEESMREEPSSEMVMLYRVFLADERALLADEKNMAKEKPSEFVAMLREHGQCPSDAVKTSAESESSRNSHIARPGDGVAFHSSTKDHPVKNSRTSLLVKQSTSRSSSVTDGKVCTPSTGQGFERPAPSHPPSSKQTVNNVVLLSNKSSEDKTNSVSKLSSHVSRGTAADSAPIRRDPLMSDTAAVEDSSEDINVEADSEKEDITATLALLNSMASELDVLDL